MMKTKDDIISWLEKYKIENYIINQDLTVDVKNNVKLERKKLVTIPIKFNKIEGDFHIFDNDLVTLEGCPVYIQGNFGVNNNKLTNLKFSPSYVGGKFYCGFNQIKTLKDCDTHIVNRFYCDNNPIKNLEGFAGKFDEKLYFTLETNHTFRFPGFEAFYSQDILLITQAQYQSINLKNNLEKDLSNSNNSKKIKI